MCQHFNTTTVWTSSQIEVRPLLQLITWHTVWVPLAACRSIISSFHHFIPHFTNSTLTRISSSTLLNSITTHSGVVWVISTARLSLKIIYKAAGLEPTDKLGDNCNLYLVMKVIHGAHSWHFFLTRLCPISQSICQRASLRGLTRPRSMNSSFTAAVWTLQLWSDGSSGPITWECVGVCVCSGW